jgi:hypothetical protein
MKISKSLFLCFLISFLFSPQRLLAQGKIAPTLYADGKEVSFNKGFLLNNIPEFISIETGLDNLDSAKEVMLYIARGAQVHLEQTRGSYEELRKFNIKNWMKDLEDGDRLMVMIKFSEEKEDIVASTEEGDLILSIPIKK